MNTENTRNTEKTRKPKAARKPKPATRVATPGPNNALDVPKAENERETLATAKAILAPGFRHGLAAHQLHAKGIGQAGFAPGIGDYADALRETGDAAAKGELAFVSRMLAAQAVTLDNVFAEMTRRAALNMGE